MSRDGVFTTTTSVTKGAPNDCGIAVRINEVESSGGVPGDWVELLFDAGPVAVDLSGFIFRDSDDPHAYVIPTGTTIAPSAYYVLEEVDFGFRLGAADAARLFDAMGTPIDTYAWTAHASTTYGRCPNVAVRLPRPVPRRRASRMRAVPVARRRWRGPGATP
jgi:hypothetical protein